MTSSIDTILSKLTEIEERFNKEDGSLIWVLIDLPAVIAALKEALKLHCAENHTKILARIAEILCGKEK